MQSSTLYWLIIGCEISFWVVLALGLAARYAELRHGFRDLYPALRPFSAK